MPELVGIGQVSAIPRHQDTAPVQGGEGHLMQEKAREGWPSLCPGHATCDKRNVSRLGMSARSTISPGTADRSRRGSAAPVGTYASLNWRSGVWTFCGLAAASEGILSESPAPWSMIARPGAITSQNPYAYRFLDRTAGEGLTVVGRQPMQPFQWLGVCLGFTHPG